MENIGQYPSANIVLTLAKTVLAVAVLACRCFDDTPKIHPKSFIYHRYCAVFFVLMIRQYATPTSAQM